LERVQQKGNTEEKKYLSFESRARRQESDNKHQEKRQNRLDDLQPLNVPHLMRRSLGFPRDLSNPQKLQSALRQHNKIRQQGKGKGYEPKPFRS
jgi:hypothetical protein